MSLKRHACQASFFFFFLSFHLFIFYYYSYYGCVRLLWCRHTFHQILYRMWGQEGRSSLPPFFIPPLLILCSLCLSLLSLLYTSSSSSSVSDSASFSCSSTPRVVPPRLQTSFVVQIVASPFSRMKGSSPRLEGDTTKPASFAVCAQKTYQPCHLSARGEKSHVVLPVHNGRRPGTPTKQEKQRRRT